MAEIEIKPRDKKPNNWLWLLALLAVVGLVLFLLTRNRDKAENTVANAGNKVEAAGEAAANKAEDVWANVNRNAPKVERPELSISSPDFEARGNDQYTVYSLGENLLFDTDQATLRSDAQQNLQQVVASIQQRYPNGQVRIYGHADAEGAQQHNQPLSQQRAESVKEWLTSNGQIDASRISIHPMGEKDPVAPNTTESGKQQNRRVEIVAINNQ